LIHIQKREQRGDVMTRTLTALATAATVAAAAVTMPTTADARGGRIGLGILGGLAAGAVVGGALAAPYNYGGGPYYYGGGPYYGYGGPYYASAPYPSRCWHRERFWDGYGWAMRRVRVC
jgi:hypothetical protein